MNTPYKTSNIQNETTLKQPSSGQTNDKLDRMSNLYKNMCTILDNMWYSGLVMFSEPYQRALVGLLDAAQNEKNRLLGERKALDKSMAENTAFLREIEQQIKHFED